MSVESVTEDVSDTVDDLMLAQMLQLEFDREHDLLVSAQEKHHNKNSKSMLLLSCCSLCFLFHYSCYFI